MSDICRTCHFLFFLKNVCVTCITLLMQVRMLFFLNEQLSWALRVMLRKILYVNKVYNIGQYLVRCQIEHPLCY